jgi:hypothetical protein
MKKAIMITTILSLILLNVRAQGLTEQENTLLDTYLKSVVTGEKEKVVSDTLNKVIPGPVYKLNAGFADPDGTSFCTQYYFIIKDGKLLRFGKEALMSVIKSGFAIKTEADAKVFEAALDQIFPLSWSSEDEKKHFKKSNNWYFVRDDFFEFYSGFEVIVDPSGKITGIRYDMKVVAK